MHFFLAAVLFSVSQPQGQGVGDSILAAAKKDLSDPTKPFTLLIQFTVKEGQAKKFEAAMTKTIEGTRKEKGNQAYELSRTPLGRGYVVYERWESLAALEAHLNAAYFKTALDGVVPLLERGTTVELLVPVPVGD
jgi:quinol monooxygenase YgiN